MGASAKGVEDVVTAVNVKTLLWGRRRGRCLTLSWENKLRSVLLYKQIKGCTCKAQMGCSACGKDAEGSLQGRCGMLQGC